MKPFFCTVCGSHSFWLSFFFILTLLQLHLQNNTSVDLFLLPLTCVNQQCDQRKLLTSVLQQVCLPEVKAYSYLQRHAKLTNVILRNIRVPVLPVMT